MRELAIALCYGMMLIFDLSVIYGLYYVLDRGGSYWWILLAVFLLIGSFPGRLFGIKSEIEGL